MIFFMNMKGKFQPAGWRGGQQHRYRRWRFWVQLLAVKSDRVSPTAHYYCDVFFELCCSGAKTRRWIPLLVTRFDVIMRV